jgi:hypothetical protein
MRGYIGKIPDKSKFPYSGKEFDEWYDKQTGEWCYDKELYEYCKSDVQLLYEGCKAFRDLFQGLTGSDPFSYVTTPSHCQAIYTTMFMPENSIPIIKDEFCEEYKRSKKEQQWLKYIEMTENVKINRQHKIDKYIVDGFDGKTIYQFYGCYWHGCKQCYPVGKNAVNNQSFVYLNKKTDKIHKNLKDKYPVRYIWEHDFDRLYKKELPEIDEEDLPLNVKHSMFGGRTETFRSYSDNVELKYYDFVSLYPTVNKYDAYPSGRCNKIKSPDNWDENWMGFAKVTITAPDMYVPILPHKSDDGKLTFSCGRKTGTWTTVEINYALEHGYKINKIHSVRTYDKFIKGMFADYVDMFVKIKIEASGLPKDWKGTPEEYQQHIYNTCSVMIDLDKLEYNEGLRFIAKLCLNSLWGKFGQNLDVDEIVYIDNEVDYLKYFDKAKRYELLNEKMVYMKIGGKKRPSFKTSMCVAAFTTANARIRLHKLIIDVLAQGGKIYYCDTDSLIFSGATIKTGNALGELSDELKGDTIVKYVSIGAKAYAYKTKNGKETIKLKGIPKEKRKHLFDYIVEIAKDNTTNITVDSGFTFKVNLLHEIQTEYIDKKISNTLNKRRFYSNGDSLPFGHKDEHIIEKLDMV